MQEDNLHNRIRDVRRRCHLRQSDVADRAGVTRQTIASIEKSRVNPSIAVALRIARALGEPVDYLFYFEPGTYTGIATQEITNAGNRDSIVRSPRQRRSNGGSP